MLSNRICLKCAVVVGLIATMTPDLRGEGGLNWFTDQAEFAAFVASQGQFLSGIEDFEESFLPANNGEAIDDPLESYVPNSPNGFPFAVGLTGLPNLIVQSNILGGDPTVPDANGVNGLAVLSVGFLEAASDVVVASFLNDSLDLIFTDEKRGIGFNPITFPIIPGDHSVEVRVYSPTNVFMGMMVIPADASGSNFVGVWAQDPIGRINIFDPNFQGEGADNIQAWQIDPPSGPTWFTDQAEFEAFMAGEGKFSKGIEDFEESILPPDFILSFDDPLQSDVPNSPAELPFPVGMTGLPNMIVQSNMGGGNPTVPDPSGVEGLVAISVGYLEVASDIVVANEMGNSLDLIFTDEKSGVGFNPISFPFYPEEYSVAVRVYSTTNVFLGLMLTPADPSGANFIGVWSSDPIGRINIFGLGAAGPGGDNIQAWQVDPLMGACCMPGDGCEILTEIDCLAAGGEYLGYGTTCGGGTPLTFEAFPELPIPDGDPIGVSHTINVPDDFSITDVNIDLTITHAFVGDLCVQVSHNDVAVQLIQRPGEDIGVPCHIESPYGCAEANYAGIVLDDEGVGGTIETQCLTDLASPPNYIPNQMLSVFNGLNAAGEWRITVIDNAGVFTGVFNSWSLEFATPDECPAHVDFFLDADEFEIALSNAGKDLKGFEDFSENILPDESFDPIDDPLDSNTSDPESFPDGILIDNLTFQSNVGGYESSQPNPLGVDGLILLTIGFQGATTGDLVLSNSMQSALDILSGPPAGGNHTALGLNLASFAYEGDGAVRVDVYDNENNFLGRIANVPAPIVGGGFLGIVASEGTTIGRVNIYDPFGFAGVYDVAAYVANGGPPCPWDLDGSGTVNTGDLLALFAQWGTAGPADFDGDGVVNTTDLLILFANWGPCP